MRTVLLCRDGVEGRFVANALAHAGRLDALVVEQGGPARTRKVRRLLRRAPWWRKPLVLVDLVAVVLYGRWIKRRLVAALGEDATTWPPVPTTHVADANDPASLDALGAAAPDLLLVSGTAILTAEVLAVPTAHALNLHGGIVPAYRNVQAEFWAVARGDRGNLGISVLHLDERVDAGAVAAMERLEAPERDASLPEVKAALVRTAARLAVAAAEAAEAGTLAADPQEGEVGVHPTPGAVALLRMAARRWR